MASAFALAIFSGKIVLLYEWKMTAVIFHSSFHALGSRRQTAASHRTADSFLFGHEFGLRHPASASCLGRHLRLAGRCPNNSSLFPPLAAVVAVALWQWQRNDYFLFAAEKSLRAFLCCFFTRGVVTSKCIKEHKCSLPVLPHSVKMCLERPAGRDKHEQ